MMFLILFFVPLLMNAQTPPVARKAPVQSVTHGDVRIDDYSWLRDRSNPEVVEYLEAENRYTSLKMEHTAELQKKLYEELLGRVKQTDLSVPEKVDDWLYYTRTEEGRQYPIYCRKRDQRGAGEEILLDVNALAAGREYFRIGVVKISPDHSLLAYSTDTDGSEVFTLRIKDLRTGGLLRESISNVGYSAEWASDSRTLYYNTLDRNRREFELRRHELGADPGADKIVRQELDEAFRLNLSKTRSRKYLLMSMESSVSTEVLYREADGEDREFRLIEPRRRDVKYYVEHHGEHFYIRTNENAVNFKLMRAPVADPARKNWKTLMRRRKAVVIEEVEAFRGHLVVLRRDRALLRIGVLDLASGKSHDVSFREPAYTVSIGDNPEFNSRTLRFTYMSPVTPASVFDYDMSARKRAIRKRAEVLGGYDEKRYTTERIQARARDGARIPITLVYRKGLRRNGGNPLLLYGYGSYGITTEPAFSSDRFSLIDRGFVYAIAHIRGSSDVSRYWYEDGKLTRKKNSFTDFIACAEHLIAGGYTSPGRLAAMGGSAGGLLMGAVLNLRPDLFRAVIAKVPFVDVINTMLDATIPLTTEEYDEWGNPQTKKFYDYMKSYSPYDNVAAKPYPNLLVTAGLNDPRVGYWEPAKWVARLRALKTGNGLLLLKTNMGAGHGGASGRYDRMKETAFDYAFLIDSLTPPAAPGSGVPTGKARGDSVVE
jgi:oligopeptidase B